VLPVYYSAGVEPRSIFASDLDGDGNLDLVVADYNQSSVYVLKNNGDGTFAPKVDYGGFYNPYAVFAEDFDNDGDQDLAVANTGILPQFPGVTVSILQNNGEGSFQNKVDYGVKTGPHSLFAEDLDGDGDRDLAVANNGGGSGNTVSILKNLTNVPNCLAVMGDINMDGFLTAADVVFMLNCVFLASGNCSFCFVDVNCDGHLTAADIVLELKAVFSAASFPC